MILVQEDDRKFNTYLLKICWMNFENIRIVSILCKSAQVAAKLQFRSRELPSHNPEEVVTVFLWRHLELLPDEVCLLNYPNLYCNFVFVYLLTKI